MKISPARKREDTKNVRWWANQIINELTFCAKYDKPLTEHAKAIIANNVTKAFMLSSIRAS